MGIMSWLGLDRPMQIASGVTRGIASPWAGEGTLAPIIADDIFGLTVAPVTRSEAMSVPPVARARHLIADTLARQPLKTFKDGVATPDQPAWLTRTDGEVGPRLRMLWTVDDCLFYGWSLWAVSRGSDGFPLDAQRVPIGNWRFNQNGFVECRNPAGQWEPPDPKTVCLIPAPSEGLLEIGKRTIRAYRELEDAWQARVHVPLGTTEISYTGDEILTEAEMANIRDTFIKARQDPNGAVMVTPNGFTITNHANEGFDLFLDGRNAATLDVSRYLNIPATLLDASNTNASAVTYESNNVARSWFLDTTLRSWCMSIEERLSADDMVPRGTYTQFDFGELVTPDNGTGPDLND